MQAVISNPNHRVYNLLAALVLIVFTAFKIPDLTLPYFWDELGVYTRAALYLADNGLSFLPGSLPPELSRGHPLLFQFLSGSAYVVFGKSVVVGHAFALCVTLLLLVLFYRKITAISNRLVAFCAMLLLVAQPVFMAQSTFVLPEMMLTLFVFLALAAYYNRSYRAFAVYAALALLVKESAIVIPFVALTYGLSRALFGEEKDYLSFRALAAAAFPFVVFVVFIVIQRIQNGWFFFPEHMGYVSFDWDRMWLHNQQYQKFLLFEQGRYQWVKVFIGGGLAMFLKKRFNPTGFTWMSIVLVTAFLAFGSLNFYMNRYMLPVFPFLPFLVAFSLYNIWKNAVWVVAVTMVLSGLSLKDLDPGYFNYDCDMGYKHHLYVEQKVLDKFCEIQDGSESIKVDFPLYYAVSEPMYTGFKSCEVSGARLELNGRLYLTTSDADIPEGQNSGWKLIYSVTDSYAKGRIYRKTP